MERREGLGVHRLGEPEQERILRGWLIRRLDPRRVASMLLSSRWTEVRGAVRLLVARLVFGAFLTLDGLWQLVHLQALAATADVRRLPGVLVALSAGALLIAAVHLVLGVIPRFGLAFAFSVLLAVSPQLHAFWAVAQGPARDAERAAFGRSVVLMAALLLFMLPPTPWAYSVDDVIRRRAGRHPGRPLPH